MSLPQRFRIQNQTLKRCSQPLNLQFPSIAKMHIASTAPTEMKLIDDATSRTNRKHTSASKLIAFVDVRMSNCCQLCKNARPTKNAGLYGIVQGTAWLSISNRVGIGFGSQFDRPAFESNLLRRTSGSPIIDDCIVLFWCIYARVL